MFFERPRRKGKKAIGKVQRDGEVYFDDFKVEHIKSPVIESSDYYPFGLTFNNYRRENSTPNFFQYNGKEKQDELSIDWLDYGARMYMPEIGRWTTIDPLADEMRSWSPYNYAFNNPISFTDPDGREPKLEEYSRTTHTISMTYDEKSNTNTVVEKVVQSKGEFKTDADGNTTWVESTTTSVASATIDADGNTIASSKTSVSSEKTYSTEKVYESDGNPAEVHVSLKKGDFQSMKIKNNSDNYNPSGHFKNLVSVASQYVKDELGTSYNDRLWNMNTTNFRNSDPGRGAASKVSKALSGGSSIPAGSSSSEVYFRSTNSALYKCNIPHTGKVPPMYHVYPVDKEFNKR